MDLVEIPDEIIQENTRTFIELLKSTKRPGIEKLIAQLLKTDFFRAPASTKYHMCCEGGLCQHSLNVYRLLKSKVYSGLIELPEESVIITALCHDICKADFYTIETRWKKNKLGKWESYTAYGIDDKLPLGHGEKSCYILQQYITLSPLEYAMIRFHMGREQGTMQDGFGNAANHWPQVAAIHTADLEASFIVEARE